MNLRFYTNVKTIGDYVYYRGYDDGIEIKDRIKYKPTLFTVSPKKTQYKTLDGRYVAPTEFNTIRAMRKFTENYKDVEGFEYFGNTNASCQLISDLYPQEEIEYDLSKVKIYVLDIETTAETGIIDAQSAQEEILLITLQDYNSKETITWGSRPFTKNLDNHNYIECENEVELLASFLDFWEENYPDIITGWNCIPVNSNIWGVNSIKKLKDLKTNELLYDSKIEEIYPISNKKGVIQVLENGSKVISSYDHKFPYVMCNPDNYTKFSDSPKNKSYKKDLKVIDAIATKDEKFLLVPLRKNLNEDNSEFTIEQCYLLGLIYTDGTLKSKSRIGDGFTIYQSDLDFIEKVKHTFNIQTKIVGPYKNCYQLHIPFKDIKNASPIYTNDNKKSLNIEIISTFSEPQFYSFLSGLLDGDGIVNTKTISLCNYNGDIPTIYQLCLWNGIFSTINSDEKVMRFIDIDFSKLNLIKDKRWGKITQYLILERDSSQKASRIRFKKNKDGYLVKVNKFIETDEMKMLDIKTDTNYFIASGVKTHNCSSFDIPYIVNRVSKIFGDDESKRLSIWKKINPFPVNINDRIETQYELCGISTLDYFLLFKKFAFINLENNRLDTVAQAVLKEKKLEHTEYETFKDFYTLNFDLFVEYNVQDCSLVRRLEYKLCLIQLAFTLAYQAKVNLEDVYSQGRMWDGIIYNYLRKRNIVIPMKKHNEEKKEKFKGAYVKEPQIGKFKYVCSLDLASLYPSLIRTYNISPETLVNEWNTYVSVDKILNDEFEIKPEHQNYTICPNGAMYNKNVQGFLPKIMEKMFNERSVYKKKMLQAQSLNEKEPSEKLESDITRYKNYQQCLKICLNSAFGSLGNSYFRFYDIRNAEAITYSGQIVIRWIEKKLNSYLNKVAGTEGVDMTIAMDTDSAILNFNPIVEKIFANKNPEELEVIDFLTKVCDGVLQDYIDKSFDELCEVTNAYQNCLHMKREKICSSALWRKKKNYILNVWDNEGVRYSEPKISMKGIEAVKTSTPAFCRGAIETAIKIIMNGTEDELINYIKKIRSNFYKLPPEDISFPSGLSNMDKYASVTKIYGKSTPIHTRGALLYNHHLKRLKLTSKYSLIQNGEKIKYCYLKLPNTIREDVISYIRTLPPELGLHKYIDYDTQFEKSFIQPLKSLLDIIGWGLEKRVNLANFYE